MSNSHSTCRQFALHRPVYPDHSPLHLPGSASDQEPSPPTPPPAPLPSPPSLAHPSCHHSTPAPSISGHRRPPTPPTSSGHSRPSPIRSMRHRSNVVLTPAATDDNNNNNNNNNNNKINNTRHHPHHRWHPPFHQSWHHHLAMTAPAPAPIHHSPIQFHLQHHGQRQLHLPLL